MVGAVFLLLGLSRSPALPSAAAERTAVRTRDAESALASHCFTDISDDTARLDPAEEQQSRFEVFPRADILRYCVGLTSESLTLSMDVSAPTNPLQDEAWQPGARESAVNNTGPLWIVAEGPGGRRGHNIFFGVSQGLITVSVFRFDRDHEVDEEEVVCEGTGSFEASAYVATVPADCLERPESVMTSVTMYYYPVAHAPYPLFADSSPSDNSFVFNDVVQRDDPQARRMTRIAGATRVETAVLLSRQVFTDGSGVVYLARADVSADAVVAGVVTDGPILLVPACGPLPSSVRSEINRLDPDRITALGGSQAVCQEMLTAAASA